MPRRFFAAIAVISGLAVGAPASADEAQYLRLVDRLDRPADGYCLDVLGSGGAFRTDMPLMAHNCKAGRAPDGLVSKRADGTLRMPAFDACVTAMGVQRTLLPGAALMLKPCGASVPFLNARAFQRFEHRADGRLAVAGHDLCLAVGPRSARTFSPAHAWRTLFVADCATVEPARSIWAFVEPAGS